MSEISIPRSQASGGRAARVRVQSDDSGAAVEAFGAGVARLGDQMEADRRQRQMADVRIAMQRDFTNLRDEMRSIRDPDEVDTAFQARRTEMQTAYIEGADRFLRDQVENTFSELDLTYSSQVGAHALDLRRDMNRAQLSEQTDILMREAASADAEGRDVLLGQLGDAVTSAVELGYLGYEEGQQRMSAASSGIDEVAARRMLADSPGALLQQLEGDGFSRLDPLRRESLRGQARSAMQAAQARAEAAQRAQRMEARQVAGAQLDVIGAAARAGRFTQNEADILADPAVQSHPAFAETVAALSLRDALPGFATLPAGQMEALIAEERARPVGAEYELDVLPALENILDETLSEIGGVLDDIIAAARSGRVHADEGMLADNPSFRAHPDIAEAIAAVQLREFRDDFGALPQAEQERLIQEEMARVVVEPYDTRKAEVMQRLHDASVPAWEDDPMGQAENVLGTPIAALPEDLSADLGGLISAIAARNRLSAGLRADGYTDVRSLLRPQERASVGALLSVDQPPEARTQLVTGLAQALGPDAPAFLREVGAEPALVHFGGLVANGGDARISDAAMRGAAALAAETVTLPPAADRLRVTNTVLGTLLADDPQTQRAVMQAAEMIYADRARGLDPRDDPAGADELFIQSLNQAMGAGTKRGVATGGVQLVNDFSTLLPIGVAAEEAERALSSISSVLSGRVGTGSGRGYTRRDLTPQEISDFWSSVSISGGTPTFGGEPVTPDMMSNVILDARGPVRYGLRIERRGEIFDLMDPLTDRAFEIDLPAAIRWQP